MGGNGLEWTRSLLEAYPYPAGAAKRAEREDLQAPGEKPRVLRGGAFWLSHRGVRCTYRSGCVPQGVRSRIGFRVVVAVRP
jgi:formylglycine-generating enzyme required for sulfatase activity